VFLIICWSVVALSVVMFASISIRAYFIGRLSIEDLSLRKSRFVDLAIDWCQNNIAYKNTIRPDYLIKHYAHSIYAGRYHPASRKCVFFIHKGQAIREIVNVVIHEFVHARQHNEDNLQMYDKYLQKVGYERNPYEIEARKVANKYEDDCLMWIYDHASSKKSH
ncbi:MAG: hypothetical protein ACO3GN_09260, partial [Bacteroidia bacterium]